MIITASDSCIKSHHGMHKCITDVIYYIVCLYLYLVRYISCYIYVQQVSHRVRGRRWLELCNAHQMATVCSEAIKLWGPQFKESSPKSTHTQAGKHTHT